MKPMRILGTIIFLSIVTIIYFWIATAQAQEMSYTGPICASFAAMNEIYSAMEQGFDKAAPIIQQHLVSGHCGQVANYPVVVGGEPVIYISPEGTEYFVYRGVGPKPDGTVGEVGISLREPFQPRPVNFEPSGIQS